MPDHARLRFIAVAMMTLLPLTLGHAAPQAQPFAVSAKTLQLNVSRSLNTLRAPDDVRRRVTATMAALNPAEQEMLASMLDPKTAELLGRPELSLSQSEIQKILATIGSIIAAAVTPTASSATPSTGGSPNYLSALYGSNFTKQCEVMLDGGATTTTYVGTGLLFFIVPASTSLNHTAQVTVHNKSNDTTSNAISYKIVAPRGYRGVYGLQFPNFGDPAIPWSAYSFCFGQSNVEFSNGTHRPSAQAWYDSTYKGEGGGGNCFGMSQLSLRIRKYTREGDTHALDRVFHGDWIKANVTWGPWMLPYNTNMKEAVQELQGTQIVDPSATYIANQRASQDNKSAWTFAHTVQVNESRPVQNTLYGHAVVTYFTDSPSADHYFYFYDNNHPYSETETCSKDPDPGTVDWNTGSFSYAGYTKTRCYYLDNLMGQPVLPSGVGGSGDTSASGDGASHPVRFEIPRRAGVIVRDESGRGGPDGAGVPGLVELVPDMGLGPIPATFPRIFLLSQPAGRRISFEIPGVNGRAQQIACYSSGGVLLASCSGAQLRAEFSQLDQRNAQIAFPDARGAGLQQVRFISPFGRDEEREVIGDSFSGLGATGLGLSLSPDRGALEVLNAPGAQPIRYRLQLTRYLIGTITRANAAQLNVTAGQLHRAGPLNWNVLQGAQLSIQRLVIPAGRLPTR